MATEVGVSKKMSEWWASSTATTLQSWTSAPASPSRESSAETVATPPKNDAAAGEDSNAPTSVIDSSDGSITATFVDPGPLGIQFDWRVHFSSDKELTVDGLAVGYQAEKVGTLQPGLVVRSINGIATSGIEEGDVMNALRQRPLCVVFGEPVGETTVVDVDTVDVDVEMELDSDLGARAQPRRKCKRRLVSIHPAPEVRRYILSLTQSALTTARLVSCQGKKSPSTVPDFPAKEIDPSLTAVPDVEMEWTPPARGPEWERDFSEKEWEARIVSYLSELPPSDVKVQRSKPRPLKAKKPPSRPALAVRLRQGRRQCVCVLV